MKLKTRRAVINFILSVCIPFVSLVNKPNFNFFLQEVELKPISLFLTIEMSVSVKLYWVVNLVLKCKYPQFRYAWLGYLCQNYCV